VIKMTSQSKSKIKTTIGLCVKNSEKTLKNCLENIINQSYPKELMEIIVVDGDSKDKTMEIATNMISNSGILSKFYSDEGEGLGTARQIVLDNINSKYVVWVDGDVLISKDFVKNQVEFMEQNPQVGVATGRYVFTKDAHTTLPALLQSLSKYVGSIEFSNTAEHRGLPPNDASIYQVKASRQVGGFDKNIKGASEDEDIIIRMRKKGWLVSVNHEAKYYAFPRETWHSLWIESSWFGYGKHYLNHKYRNLHVHVYNTPLIFFFVGLKAGLKAYKLTLHKNAFLLPLASVFSKIAWWFGFIKSHMEGYGHQKG